MQTLEPFRDPSCISAKLPEANGTWFILKRVSEMLDDFGSIPRTPHILLSSIKQPENAGLIGLSLFVA